MRRTSAQRRGPSAGRQRAILFWIGCALVVASGAMTGEGAAAADLSAEIRAAEEALRIGEPQLAESRYRDALLDAWMRLGACDALAGDLDAARASFERAATQALELRRPLFALAAVETRLGQADAAVRHLRRLLARDPDDLTTRRLLARALTAAGLEAEAVQELSEAYAATKKAGLADPELAFSLATGHLRIGEADAAAELFDAVAAARPIPETQILIGRTWRDFGHYERARRSFRRALAGDGTVRKARFYLGTVELLDEGRGALGDAIEHFRAELEIAPDDPLTHLFLGLALVETRRFGEALAHLERATADPGTRLDALHYSGRALLGLARHAEAEPLLRRALELSDPESTSPHQLAGLHYQLALTLRALDQAQEARVHFDAAREQMAALGEESRESLRRYLEDAPDGSPRASSALPIPTAGLDALPAAERRRRCRDVATIAARAHLNLGVLQARAGEHGRAAGFFRDALAAALHPGRGGVADGGVADEGLTELAAQARYSLGVTLFSAGRHGEALAPLERAFDDAPSPTLRRLLALTRLEVGEWQGAAELLAAELRAADQGQGLDADPSLLYAYGKALVRSGRADEALPVFERLSRGEAENPELLALFGEAHAREGDWARAEESLRRAIALDAEVGGAHRSLGELHMRRGELAAAESELRAELAGHPDDVRARFLLATVLDLAEKPGEAEEAVRRVLEARPRDTDARYLLGKILLGRGEAEAAASQLEAALESGPGDYNIRYQLALAYQRLGRRDAAREQFDAYRQLKAAASAEDGDADGDVDGDGDGDVNRNGSEP